MSKSSLLTLTVIFVLLLLAGCATYYIYQSNQEAERNQARRDLVTNESETPFTDLRGNEMSLESYLGQVLIVNAWASWSPYSADELPLLNTVASAYDEVVVLAINRSETKEQTERYMRTLPELSNIEFVLDADDRYFKAIDGYAMPETIIYNQKGEVILHRRGVITEAELRTTIDSALEDE